MSTIGLYRPGESLLHRIRPGFKLTVLVAAGVGSVFLNTTWQVLAAVGAVLIGYLLAGFSPRTIGSQSRPLLWVLVAIGAFHWIVTGPARAFTSVGVILALVLLAGLVTPTTRSQDLSDCLVGALRPLRRVGFDPERFGLLLALSLRSVPVIVALAHEVRDAQQARGLTASSRAFAVPLLIRALRHADALGEALVARGVDD